MSNTLNSRGLLGSNGGLGGGGGVLGPVLGGFCTEELGLRPLLTHGNPVFYFPSLQADNKSSIPDVDSLKRGGVNLWSSGWFGQILERTPDC